MIVTIMFGLMAIFFAYIAQYRFCRWGLFLSFSLIFIFLAFRYNYGNDYETYLKIFKFISQYKINELAFLLSSYEPGWIIINWLFRHIGFFALVAFISLLNSVIYFQFIRNYVPAKYYWLAVYIYIFLPNFMLIHSSAMRQSIAIMLFIYSLKYLLNRKIIKYLICVIFASLFHYSAIVLFPLCLLAYSSRKITLISGILLFSFYVSLFVFKNSLTIFISLIVENIFGKYVFYQNASKVSSGLGFLYYSFIFIITLIFQRKQDNYIVKIYKIAILNFLIIPLALIIDMTGRIGLYFSPSLMIIYPTILVKINKYFDKTIFIILVVIVVLFMFFQFFYSDIYSDYYLVYHSIFSAKMWY